VERIEVVRGPLSSFFGSTGLSGVVNVITRRGRPGPLAGQASLAAGNAALRQANGSLSGGLGRGAYLLGGGWEEESHRIAREGFRQLNLYGNLDQPLGPAELRLAGRASRWHGDDYPDASGGPLYGNGALRRSDHREDSLAGEVDLGAGEHPSRWTASIYRHDLDRTSPAILRQVPAATESTSFTHLRGGGAGTLHAGQDSQLSAGIDAGEERGVNHSLLALAFPPGTSLRGDYRATRTSLGAFAEALIERGANFTCELGGRLDRVDGAGARGGRTRASPRLGLSYRPSGGATRLHASAGTAFKLPSFFALASPRALGGNPGLRPETGAGGDAGLDHRFAAARLDLEANVFYNRFRDLIDFDFQRFLHVNRSSVAARGAELALAWRPAERLSAALDATWQEVTDLATHAPLRHRPRWVGGGHLDWQPTAALRLRLDSQGTSRSLDQQLPVPSRDSVAGYQVIGAGGSWQLAERWQLRGRIDNLAGRRYQVLIGFPGAGRAVRLGLHYTS
jgi:vitamin B12 transporter